MDEDAYLVDDQHAYNDCNYDSHDDADGDFTCEMIWEECPLTESYASRKCSLYKDCKAGNCE